MADEFQTGDAGASATFPVTAGSVKKGGYVVLKGNPCKCVDYSTSKTGKHGHAKASIVGLDIFTKKKYEEVVPTSHTIASFKPVTLEYQLVDIGDDGFLSLMTDDGDMREDLSKDKPSDATEEVREQLEKIDPADATTWLVQVTEAMGFSQIQQIREGKDQI